jgi:hypothetical protein
MEKSDFLRNHKTLIVQNSSPAGLWPKPPALDVAFSSAAYRLVAVLPDGVSIAAS